MTTVTILETEENSAFQSVNNNPFNGACYVLAEGQRIEGMIHSFKVLAR